jgi:ketosteroid isomerase-like protein
MTAVTDIQQAACQRCLAEHIGAENAHDVDAIMRTYADGAVVEVNGQRFQSTAEIRRLHATLGFGGAGTLGEIVYREGRRFIAGDTTIVEGALEAVHVADYGPLPATGRKVAIPFCAIYEFAQNAKLRSERVYLDIAFALRH